MADIEKVIKGLECCRIDENRHINCADCPYYTDDDKGQMWCSNEINNDAIELLKEKQPVKPIQFEKKSKVTRDKFECGACGGSEVFKQWEYCPWCGVRLDW